MRTFDGISDADMLARIMDAEAGQEGPLGKLAVGAVIQNRAKVGGYGDGLRGVITKPGQFSAINDVTGYAGGKGANQIFWNNPSEESVRIAQAVLAGQYEDPTGGATHYFNPKAADPKWARGKEFRPIGNHVFGNADAGRVSASGGADTLQGGPSQDELMQEAIRRGLIPREELEAEARKRGLIQDEPMQPDPRDRADVEHALAQLGDEERQSVGGKLLDAFTQGVSLGFGDELTAAEAALFGKTPDGGWFDYSKPWDERYSTALGAERGQIATAAEESPELTIPAEIAGGVASLAVPGGAAMRAVKGGNLATKVTVGGATAAGQGAVYGFGEGEGGLDARLESAQDAATVAGAVGMVLPFAGRGVSKVLNAAKSSKASKQLRAIAPTLDSMKAQAGALFKAAENHGAVVSPTSFGNMAIALHGKIAKEGIDQALHPKAYAALNRVLEDAASGQQSLGNLQTLRRVIGTAAKSGEPDERRLASIMLDTLDGYVEKLKPGDLVSGTVGDAPKLMADGRKLWGQMRRAEIVENIIEKAGDQASGFENGIRAGFRALLKPNNPMRRGFSKEEIAAMRQIVQGGNGFERGLRVLGKMSFDRSGSTNFLGGSVGIAGGSMLGGPVGAVAAPMIGQTAQRTSAGMTGRAADTVRAMAATGQTPASNATNRAIENRVQQLLMEMNSAAIPLNSDTP